MAGPKSRDRTAGGAAGRRHSFRAPDGVAGQAMTRGKQETRRAQALDAGLKGMFRALALRPLPDTLRAVVDQLDRTPDEARPTRRRQA